MNSDRIHQAGTEIVAISVDDEVRQAGMAQRWGLDQIRFVSDPGGETYLKPLGLFDPVERGGIGLPAMVGVGPNGAEIYRYMGRDFADRTNDDDIWPAIESLNLPPVNPERWEPNTEVPPDLRGFFRPQDFGGYFRGNFYGSIAIGMRLGDQPEAAEVAGQHTAMSKATLDAWKLWRDNAQLG